MPEHPEPAEVLFEQLSINTLTIGNRLVIGGVVVFRAATRGHGHTEGVGGAARADLTRVGADPLVGSVAGQSPPCWGERWEKWPANRQNPVDG